MKKLRKLEINPERLMKDEELVVLRGGYGGCQCDCYNSSMQFMETLPDEDALSCFPECVGIYEGGLGHWHC